MSEAKKRFIGFARGVNKVMTVHDSTVVPSILVENHLADRHLVDFPNALIRDLLNMIGSQLCNQNA